MEKMRQLRETEEELQRGRQKIQTMNNTEGE